MVEFWFVPVSWVVFQAGAHRSLAALPRNYKSEYQRIERQQASLPSDEETFEVDEVMCNALFDFFDGFIFLASFFFSFFLLA